MNFLQIHLMYISKDGKSAYEGVMVSKLDSQTYSSVFKSHWVPLSCGFVLHLSKKFNKYAHLTARGTFNKNRY